MYLPMSIGAAKDIPGLLVKLDDFITMIDDMMMECEIGYHAVDDEMWAEYDSAKAMVKFLRNELFKATHKEELIIEQHCQFLWSASLRIRNHIPLGLRITFKHMWA